jgi:hypothetical protein
MLSTLMAMKSVYDFMQRKDKRTGSMVEVLLEFHYAISMGSYWETMIGGKRHIRAGDYEPCTNIDTAEVAAETAAALTVGLNAKLRSMKNASTLARMGYSGSDMRMADYSPELHKSTRTTRGSRKEAWMATAASHYTETRWQRD